MDGRSAGHCLAQALEIDAKHKLFRIIPNPYVKTFTKADLVVAIVLEASPDSCRDLKNDKVLLMDISDNFSLWINDVSLRKAELYCLIVDSVLSDSVKEILSESI